MSSSLVDKMRKDYIRYLESEALAGEALDDRFISAGFCSVNGEREYIREVFGCENYYDFLARQGAPEFVERIRSSHEQWSAKFISSKKNDNLDETAEEMLRDQGLPPGEKYYFLARFVPRMLKPKIGDHILNLTSQITSEQKGVCELFPPPGIDLADKSNSKLRKQIFNEVTESALSPLGFACAGKTEALNGYEKKLSREISIQIFPDARILSGNYSKEFMVGTEYWFSIPLEIFVKFSKTGSRFSDSGWILDKRNDSIAERRIGRYEDSSSLEVAIRGLALWYESVVLPFESRI